MLTNVMSRPKESLKDANLQTKKVTKQKLFPKIKKEKMFPVNLLLKPRAKYKYLLKIF